MPNTLHTIADFIRYTFSRLNSEDVFFGHGTDNSWDESVQLVLQSLSLPWDFDTSMWQCSLTSAERERIRENIARRIEDRIPLAYITKQAWFCGQPYYVDERTLVPRSPIAELIDGSFCPWLVDEPTRIMDLCTGSGCIGIALAHQFPNASVDLVDISADALEVANINRQRHEVEARTRAIQSDLFEAIEKNAAYDLIVSNPPYVDQEDFNDMPEEYKAEPELGLIAGSEGLDIVRRILNQAKGLLSSHGLLVVELGNSWVALEQAYPDFPFTWVEFEHGGHGVFVMSAQELNSRAW